MKKDLEGGMSLKAAAEKYGVSCCTAGRILKELVPPRPRGGEVYRKLTPAASKFMANRILDDVFVTSKQLASQLHEQGVDVHASSVNRHLSSSIMVEHGCPRFSVKRVVSREDARNSQETLSKRKDFVLSYQQLRRTGAPFVFVDESSFNCFENRIEGRSPVGSRCINRRRRVKLNNVTAITAVSDLLGVIHVTFVEGGVDHNVFRIFLTSVFDTLRLRIGGEAVVVVMDNAPIHRTEGVQELIDGANHRLLFNAPWSCELNPIEYVFGLWKRRVIIPANASRIVEVLPILDSSFASITRLQVARFVQFVERRLHQRAWDMESMDLDQTMAEAGAGEREEHNELAVVQFDNAEAAAGEGAVQEELAVSAGRNADHDLD